MTIGHNAIDGKTLLGFVERIEAKKRLIKTLNDDVKVILAEAGSAGLSPKGLRFSVKVRKMKPSEFREAEETRDLYLHAIGLAAAPPLFRHLEGLAHDALGRAEIVERLKELVPAGASFTLDFGGEKPLRLFRDAEGKARAEEVKPIPPAPSAAYGQPAGRRSEEPPPPDVDATGAGELGQQAARDNQPIIDNPFPFGDERRARWDEAWRRETGSDGMGPGDDE